MHVFGPVLAYDLVRVARRGRYILLRAPCAAVLLGLLYLTYQGFAPEFATGWASPKQLAAFAEHFFHIFLLSQFVMVCILTPAYVGDAIAEEKQRGTLDYLLTTELSSREIVLGKLISRLANVVLFLLVGLPILSLTQLFGGISIALLLGGVAALLLTLLSIGAISICFSVYARTPRDAIMFTFLVLLSYAVGWYILILAAGQLGPLRSEFPLAAAVGGHFMDLYRSGNPILGFMEFQDRIRMGSMASTVVLDLLSRFGVFHGLVTVACVSWAVIGLRRAFRKHKYATAPQSPTEPTGGKPSRIFAWKRRAMGGAPMIWKEVHVGRHARRGWIATAFGILLALAILAPAFFVLVQSSTGAGSGYSRTFARGIGWTTVDWLANAMNDYIKQFGTLLCSIVILAVGVRAASSIGAERDKQTLDGLLASPLTTGEIIFAKWWGSIVGIRRLLYLVGIIWLLGVCTGGLHPLAVPILALLLLIYTIFMASLGLWFAVWTGQTLRAVMGTLMGGIFLGSGAWICVWMVEAISRYGGRYWWIVPIVLALSVAYAAMLGGLLLLSAMFARARLQPRLGRGMTDFLVIACPFVAFVVAMAMIADGWDRNNSLELMATGLTPPAVLALFALPRHAAFLSWAGGFDTAIYLVYCVVGVGGFGLAGCTLGLAAADRFRRKCGRVDVHDSAPVPRSEATVVAAWGP